ncbi:oligosaccharide flippase family protein [Klebsiella pneumoniae]|nr:oligosaccharide flippase family protein [Klebsiella pneumoniae]ELA3317244.1 oligosaccharide flippase family protein [Klebsiella pneumoniae]
MKKNIFLLLIVQIASYALPLITLPYLLKVLGVYNYGIIAIYLAIVQYVFMVIDFGFSFISVRRASVVRTEKFRLSKIFTLTIASKAIIFIFIAILCVVYVLFTDVEIYRYICIIALITVFFNIFDTTWLFQAIEKLSFCTFFNVISKTVYVILTFILVKNQNDLILALICYALSSILSVVMSAVYIKITSLVSFTKIRWQEIKTLFLEGADIFLANISISFYTTFNTILLGWLAGPLFVGYFSSADKIRAAAQGLLNPVQQAMFPRVSKLIHEGVGINRIIACYGKWLILWGVLITLGLLLLGREFIFLYLGDGFDATANILMILALLPFGISVAIVYGPWWLAGRKKTKKYRGIYLTHSLLHCFYAVPLIYYYPMYGVAISIVLTEFLVAIRFYIERK